MATINKDTFYKIFKNKEEVLAMMASSLTRTNIELYKKNITCNINNPKKLQYIIYMKNNYTIEIKDTKNNKITTIDLSNKNL